MNLPESELHDIHGPITLPTLSTETQVLLFVGGLFLMICFGILYYRFKRRKKASQPPILPAKDLALKAIENTTESFLKPGKDRQFCEALSNALRTFIERSFGINTVEATTEELLKSISNNPKIERDDSMMLSDFFKTCDLAKFASHSFSKADKDRLIKKATAFITGATVEKP